MKTYVALHTDPQFYGSECTNEQAETLNATLVAACDRAGIDCYTDLSKPQSSDLEYEGAESIDWFAQSCAGGWDWSVDQWVTWLGEVPIWSAKPRGR